MDNLFESTESWKRYQTFISSWDQPINTYYQRFGNDIIQARAKYPQPLLQRRNNLEQEIQKSLTTNNLQIPGLWTDVEIWGGFQPVVEVSNPREHIIKVTMEAFALLTSGKLRESAKYLKGGLRNVGISRATKMLALSDQVRYGIYDSRAGNGLSPLVNENGKPLIPVPFGRAIQGTSGNKAIGFENYTWVLRCMLPLFQAQPNCGKWKVCDIEMGLFMLVKEFGFGRSVRHLGSTG